MAVPEKDYLTTREIAERYRCEPSTVRYWRHIGYGPKGTRVGRRVLYPRTEIEKFDRQICRKPTAAGAA